METICTRITLRPDSVGRIREWAVELRSREREVLATLEDEGVLVESAFLDHGPRGDFLIYYMKARSLEVARATARASLHPIDAYHQRVKRETWESTLDLELLVDFTDPRVLR